MAVLIIILLASSLDVLACSCVWLERPCERMDADAIFVGRVVETTPIKQTQEVTRREIAFTTGYKMRFQVEEALRGVESPEVIVSTGSGGGDCGTPLEPGSRFLIFAHKLEAGGLYTGLCSGNRVLEGVRDREILEPYRAAMKQRSSVYGTVYLGSPVLDEYGSIEEGQGKPWAGVNALLASAEIGVNSVTGHDGTFEFPNLPNGTYRVQPALPDGFDYDRNYDQRYVAIVADGSCQQVSFRVLPSTRIRGKLVLPPGAPEKSIQVVAIPASMQKAGQFAGKWDYTGEQREFDLWPLIPGDYVVTLNAIEPPSEDAPYAPTYYPGVTSRAAASVIHVDEGRTVEIEFHVPAVLEQRLITVQVLSADKKPLGGEAVSVEIVDISNPDGTKRAAEQGVNAAGKTSLSGYAGRRYRISGYLRNPNGGKSCSASVVVKEGSEPAAVTLVVNGAQCM